MFKRRPQQLTDTQAANRMVNKFLTYGLLAFLFYILFFNSKSPQLKHFDFTTPNYTPIDLPPILEVKNSLTGEVSYFQLKARDSFQFTLPASEIAKLKAAKDNEMITLYEVKYVGK